MSAGSKKNTPIKATKLSVDEISTVTQSGTLKLSENLEIGGDGLILSDLLSGSDSKKIISLDSGNLVISTYTDGIRSEHEIILDTNNNISEILNSLNESAMNLEILSLDVTTSGTTGTTAPGDGNARIDGSLSVGTTIGHPSDPDLITLADGSVTFTGTTVIPTADINGGAIDGVTIGTNSACTSLVATTADINAGTVDATIGGTTPASGTFTNLTTNNFIINTPQTINVGGSGITVTNTSYTTEPTNSIVYLKATDDSNGSIVTYVWTLDSFNGTSGQVLHIFFNNAADTNVKLKITFGTDGLATGNGTNDALTFSSRGQSASLIYIDSIWCILNTGATVS